MDKLKILLKLKMRNDMRLSDLAAYLRSGPKAVGLFVLGVLLALSIVGSFVLVYGISAAALQSAASDMGQPALMPALLLTAGQILLIFTGFFTAFHLLSSGRDREFMASLPLTGGQVFTADMLWSYLIETLFSAIVVLPVLIVYSLSNPVSLFYWLCGILGIFLFPAFPLALSLFLVALMMTAAGRFRHRELLLTVFSFLVVIGILLAGQIFNSAGTEAPAVTEQAASLLRGRADAVRTASLILFPAAFLSGGMTRQGPDALLCFLGLAGTAGLFWLLCPRFGDRWYFKLLQRGGSAAVKGKKKISRKDLTGGSQQKAFFVKEWRVLLRSPVFAVNGLINVAAGPALALFMLWNIGKGQNSPLVYLHDLAERSPQSAFCVMTGFSVLMAGMNLVSATAFSREGPAFWICKTVPVPVRTQIKGRFWVGYTVYLLGAAPMLILFGIFLPVSALRLVFSALLTLTAGAALTGAQLAVDLTRPKLYWSKEAEAIKQNVNGIFAMLISLGFSFFLLIPAILSALGLFPEWTGILFSALICAAGACLGFFGTQKYAEKVFVRIW